MATQCTRCEGWGFLNLHQLTLDADLLIENAGHDAILKWIKENTDHDVQVCDCCGDGEDWYGTPGEHYNADDPQGNHGPYASNGGLCRCH